MLVLAPVLALVPVLVLVLVLVLVQDRTLARRVMTVRETALGLGLGLMRVHRRRIHRRVVPPLAVAGETTDHRHRRAGMGQGLGKGRRLQLKWWSGKLMS